MDDGGATGEGLEATVRDRAVSMAPMESLCAAEGVLLVLWLSRMALYVL